MDTVTQQNLWYSIYQLIMGQTVISRAFAWNGIVLAFDEMNPQYPLITYSLKDYSIKECNNSLSVAYTTISTTYLNHVENLKEEPCITSTLSLKNLPVKLFSISKKTESKCRSY